MCYNLINMQCFVYFRPFFFFGGGGELFFFGGALLCGCPTGGLWGAAAVAAVVTVAAVASVAAVATVADYDVSWANECRVCQ